MTFTPTDRISECHIYFSVALVIEALMIVNDMDWYPLSYLLYFCVRNIFMDSTVYNFWNSKILIYAESNEE